MFNSVANFFWGSADDESEGAKQPTPQEDQQGLNDENLSMLQEEDGAEDDWVLVGNSGKENSKASAQPHPLLHHPNPHLFSHPSNNHQHQSHHSPYEPPVFQQLTEVELLDEAASLVHPNVTDPCDQLSLPDCDNKSSSDPEDNGVGSGVRPSSPESVFSACSGRSSATYRPRGLDSEAWVVAPPPCFTGSQCDSLSPVVSGPLENLLIEHPSMSVYVSQPASLISSVSHDFRFQGLSSALHVSGSTLAALPESPQIGNGSLENLPAESPANRPERAVQGRRSPGETVAHQQQLTLKTLRKVQDAAQRKALSVSQTSVNRHRCQRQNQVLSRKSLCNSRKMKQLKPSGFRSSRMPQRNFSKHL